MKLKILVLLATLVFVVPAFGWQDDDAAEDSSPEVAKAAFLNAAYDQNGSAQIDFAIGVQPSSWDGIQRSLSQMFDCSADRFLHPATDPYLSSYLNKLPAAQRQKRLGQFEAQNALRLQAQCPASAQRKMLTFTSTIDTSSLIHELQASGVSRLELLLLLPPSPYVEFSGVPEPKPIAGNTLLVDARRMSRHVSIPIAERTSQPRIEIAFGWSRAIVIRTVIRMLIFVLLPIMILLRVRSLSLRTFRDDPTRAWFAYMKTLGWCTNGGMLLWYLTNLGGRLDLEKLLNFILPAGQHIATFVNLTVYFIPAALIYLACISISHRVFVDVKKAQYTWTQFLTEHSLTLAQRIVPIACFSAAIGFHSEPKMLAGLMFIAYMSAILLSRWRMKVTTNYPKIVLAGELRDRVFAFAEQAGVKLQQVVILPAQRMQIANAFASTANTVTFTDFLLERMSKREIDAIAGHELTHLKRSHPAKLTLAMVAACFAPLWLLGLLGGLMGFAIELLIATDLKIPPPITSGFYRSIMIMSNWGVDGFIAVTLAFAGVYALSRRFERQADAGAVALTKDPEAMITALLKLGSLNLTPLSWGNGTGASLTHPSTLKRVQRIADNAGIANTRLNELIAQFSVEKLSHVEIETVTAQHKEGDHYAMQQGGDVSQKVVSDSQNLLMILVALIVIPPALVEFAVEHLHIAAQLRTAIYCVGLVLITTIYFLAMKLLPLRRLVRQKALRLKAIEKECSNIKEFQSEMVGFAPGPAPRIYVGTYNFDIGALLLTKERMIYLGRQLKFSLTRRQVLSIQTGPGTPSWWPQERIYVRWQNDATGEQSIFSFSGQEPCSLSQVNSRVRELYSKLLTWRLRGQVQQVPAQFEALSAPQIGEVTCKKPRETLSLKIQFSVIVIIGLAIWLVSSILGINAVYLWLTAIVLRIFESVPYLFYREPKEQKKPAVGIGKPATATAAV